MQWRIRYRGVAGRTMSADVMARVHAELRSDPQMLPGLSVSREDPAPGHVLFSGELQVEASSGYREVAELLDALVELERGYPGLNLILSDSLGLLRRGADGRFTVSTEALEDPDDGDWDLDDDDDWEDDDDIGFGSDVYAGPDPAAPRFGDATGPTPLGPRELLPCSAELVSRLWTIDSLQLARRQAVDKGGYVYVVSAEVVLQGAEAAHLVDADVALVTEEGHVVAAEGFPLGFDVHRGTDLWFEVPVEAELADRVARIEVGLDAYYRTEHFGGRWIDGRGVRREPDPAFDLRWRVRRPVWPYECLLATGTLRNTSGSFLATVELSFQVFDDASELLSDDTVDLGMIGIGESRPVSLSAPLDAEDEPARAVVQVRLVSRGRERLLAVHPEVDEPSDS